MRLALPLFPGASASPLPTYRAAEAPFLVRGGDCPRDGNSAAIHHCRAGRIGIERHIARCGEGEGARGKCLRPVRGGAVVHGRLAEVSDRRCRAPRLGRDSQKPWRRRMQLPMNSMETILAAHAVLSRLPNGMKIRCLGEKQTAHRLAAHTGAGGPPAEPRLIANPRARSPGRYRAPARPRSRSGRPFPLRRLR